MLNNRILFLIGSRSSKDFNGLKLNANFVVTFTVTIIENKLSFNNNQMFIRQESVLFIVIFIPDDLYIAKNCNDGVS